MCRSSNVLWGRGVLLPHFTDGMVGQRGTVAPGSQMLPLMEKHQSFLPVIPPQRCLSLCASRSIRATTNQTLNQRPSCAKNEIFSSFVEGGWLGLFQHMRALPWVSVWHLCWLHCCFWWQPWTSLAGKNPCRPLWDFRPQSLCEDVSGKAMKLQLHLETWGSN